MDELINRKEFCDFWRKNYRHQYANDTFLFAIANFPTTDAAPVVHGHWDGGKGHGYCCCSNCRDVYILEEWLVDGKWNYCPNCGAKMDGDGNG